MLEIFNYSFMVKAFLGGIAIGIIAPVIGTFLVSRRYSLIADTLSHVSLAGIAIGLLTGIYPVYTALICAVIASILLEKLRTNWRVSGESALAMLLSGGLALAVVLMSIAKGFNVNLFSYLFGSITTVTETDVWLICILGLVVLSVIYFSFKELFYVSFDEEAARVSGVKVDYINFLLSILTAVTVVLSIRIVGALLIGALMVIPVITATYIAKSFRSTVLISIIISLLSVIGGLFVSYYLNLAAGGTIVVFSLVLFTLSLTLSKALRT